MQLEYDCSPIYKNSSFMNKIVFFLLSMFSLSAFAQEHHFVLSLDTVGRYVDIQLTVPVKSNETLLKMPVWAPGYYMILDYPRYVVDFAPSSLDGKVLEWKKSGKNGWLIETEGIGDISVRYRVLAKNHSVADSHMNSEGAFIAPNGLFMYLDGAKDQPAVVDFQMPANWTTISTSLKHIGGNTYSSENFDQLFDTPVLLGNQMVRKFEVDGKEYEIALETIRDIDETTFVSDLKKMVKTTTDGIGHIPYDKYSFLLLGPGGGGLEHAASQASYSGNSLKYKTHDSYLNFLCFITHEFYHLYNVKHIRPIELGPFDYDKEVYSPLIWVSEGFTVYYETRNLLLAGIIDYDFLLNRLSSVMRRALGTDSYKHMSLRDSSYDIWLHFLHWGENPDAVVSYYDLGPVFGLIMDAEIRNNTDGQKSLDDLMRLLYFRYDQQLQRGFTEEEFWAACAEINGKPMSEIRSLTERAGEIDVNRFINPVGLTLDDDFTLRRIDNPTKRQQMLLKGME